MPYCWYMTHDELVQEAEKCRVDVSLFNAVLHMPTVESARALLQRVAETVDDPYLGDWFACAVLDAAVAQGNTEVILGICAIMLEISYGSLSAIAELEYQGGIPAILILRKYLEGETWKGATKIITDALIHLEYVDDMEAALNGASEMVRHTAVLNLEKQGNTTALMAALRNDVITVRRVAAWYMGRKIVQEAVEPLLELVKNEQDIETKRAAVWALGVIGDHQT